MSLEDCACLVLAAGRSRRFGDADKLMHNLGGATLVSRVCTLINNAGIKSRLAVVPSGAAQLRGHIEQYGFDALEAPSADAGLGDNIAHGARALCARQAPAIFLLLADMPFVTLETLTKLRAACPKDGAAIASDGQMISPPAIFSSTIARILTTLKGDIGARTVLGTASRIVHVPAPSLELFDIDTQTDLHIAQTTIVAADRSK